MNRTTSLLVTIWERRSLVSDMGDGTCWMDSRDSVGNRGDQLQGVQLAAHPAAERLVDHLVLLHPVAAGEGGRDHARAVVIAVVDQRFDLDFGIGQRGLDQRGDFGGGHGHCQDSLINWRLASTAFASSAVRTVAWSTSHPAATRS